LGSNTKVCGKCGEEKSRESFYERRKGSRDGLQTYCKTCAYKTIYHIHYEYNLTEAEYVRMAESQNGKCAICESEEKLFVDHDHANGRIRGLLCNKCNAGLGYFKDNPYNLRKANDYLASFS
jgi:hypothetical protein